MNRAELSRALAKAIAYAQQGQRTVAEAWAIDLMLRLGMGHLLSQAAIDQGQRNIA